MTVIAAAAGQRLRQGLFRVQALAALIENDRRQIGAEPHRAGIRRQHPDQHVQQRRLAGAVRADDADPVAAHDPRRKIPHDRPAAIGLRDPDRLRDQPARHLGLRRVQPHRARRPPMFSPLAAQRVQFGQPPLVARAPCGDAVAQPVLLHRDLAPELVLFAFLLFEDRVAPRLETGKTLVERAGDAAIEPHGRPRQAFRAGGGHG